MKSAFEKAHKARFGFIDRSKQLVVEAVSVEAVGGGAKFRETRRTRPRAASSPRPPARTQFFSNGKWHKAAVYTRDQLAPGAQGHRPRHRHRAAPDRRGRGRLARRDHREEPSRAGARRGAQAHQARSAPRPIRSCSRCSTTCSCRSPSRWACRCRTPPIRSTSRSGSTSPARCSRPTRTLVANAPHMPVHLGSMDRAVETIIRENKGKIRAGRRLSDQRALQRRHAPARHHRLHAGVRQGQEARSCSGSRRAATTPMSAASRRARCRRSPPRSRRKASTSTTSSWSIAASSARQALMRAADQGASIRRATRCRTSTT